MNYPNSMSFFSNIPMNFNSDSPKPKSETPSLSFKHFFWVFVRINI